MIGGETSKLVWLGSSGLVFLSFFVLVLEKDGDSLLMDPQYLGKSGVLLQPAPGYCGPAALKMALDHHGFGYTLDEIARRAKPSPNGVSMLVMRQVAEQTGLRAEGRRLSYEELVYIPLPSIAFVETNHFVVISEVSPNSITVLDPAQGRQRYSRDAFERIWFGELLILEPTHDPFFEIVFEAPAASGR